MHLFNAEAKSNLVEGYVVDDVVMGGRSAGQLQVGPNGQYVFSGHVSLENNGGFSSIRLKMASMKTSKYSKVVLRVKGDGKRYQFRMKANKGDYYSYIKHFETNGDAQTISIPFEDFIASFRGRTLDMDPFSGEKLGEIGFLIANKKAENFKLEIEQISLQ